ncbi:MAG: ion transporter [Actinobacteria bacterium]|nr:MAG: ion transporter [Actinomycetota bacterium]
MVSVDREVEATGVRILRRLRFQLWELLELTYDPVDHSPVFDWLDMSLLALICLNVSAVILETVDTLGRPYAAYFYAFEVFSVAVFTVEYLLRLWACTADPRYNHHPIQGRLHMAFSFLGVVDLAAIVPFYLHAVLPIDLRFIRALRLFRLTRMLKVGRYSESLQRMGDVFSAKKADLAMAVFTVVILLILASSGMYYAEHAAQPEVFSSIPASMWWGVTTLTTVGYGDMLPITPLGKLLGAIIAVLGIGLFALPTGILAAGYSEELQKHRRDRGRCLYCGAKLGSQARPEQEDKV